MGDRDRYAEVMSLGAGCLIWWRWDGCATIGEWSICRRRPHTMRPLPAGLRLGWSTGSEPCAARSLLASRPTPGSFTPLTRVRSLKGDGRRSPSRTGEPCMRSRSSGASRPPAEAPRTPLHDCQPPTTGDLGPAGLRTLCEILRGHMQDRSQCWFAVWEGWGELTGVNTVTAAAFGGSPPAPRQAPARWQLDLRAAKFTLPGRASQPHQSTPYSKPNQSPIRDRRR